MTRSCQKSRQSAKLASQASCDFISASSEFIGPLFFHRLCVNRSELADLDSSLSKARAISSGRVKFVLRGSDVTFNGQLQKIMGIIDIQKCANVEWSVFKLSHNLTRRRNIKMPTDAWARIPAVHLAPVFPMQKTSLRKHSSHI